MSVLFLTAYLKSELHNGKRKRSKNNSILVFTTFFASACPSPRYTIFFQTPVFYLPKVCELHFFFSSLHIPASLIVSLSAAHPALTPLFLIVTRVRAVLACSDTRRHNAARAQQTGGRTHQYLSEKKMIVLV